MTFCAERHEIQAQLEIACREHLAALDATLSRGNPDRVQQQIETARRNVEFVKRRLDSHYKACHCNSEKSKEASVSHP